MMMTMENEKTNKFLRMTAEDLTPEEVLEVSRVRDVLRTKFLNGELSEWMKGE